MATVELTEAAAGKAIELLQKSETPSHALRVRVIDGGCSGMRYELAFDAQANGDELSEQFGVRVVVDAESARFLAGTTVDYLEGLNESGFQIRNPSASETCGCGESFSV